MFDVGAVLAFENLNSAAVARVVAQFSQRRRSGPFLRIPEEFDGSIHRNVQSIVSLAVEFICVSLLFETSEHFIMSHIRPESPDSGIHDFVGQRMFANASWKGEQSHGCFEIDGRQINEVRNTAAFRFRSFVSHFTQLEIRPERTSHLINGESIFRVNSEGLRSPLLFLKQPIGDCVCNVARSDAVGN